MLTMELRPKTHSSELYEKESDFLTAEELRKQIPKPVPYYFGKEYSKLEAIARIAEIATGETELSKRIGKRLAHEVQWLLVDRGMLFAQTRARYYPLPYNWQRVVQEQPVYRGMLETTAQRRRDEKRRRESYLEAQVRVQIERARKSGFQCCLSVALAVRWMKKVEALWSGEFAAVQIYPERAWNSLMQEPFWRRSAPKNEDPSGISSKIQTHITELCMGPDPQHARRAETLLAGGSAVQRAEFLVYVLRPLLEETRLLQKTEMTCQPYEDALARRDLQTYLKMVECNDEWNQDKTWEIWKTAAPVIQEYLHPETLWGTGEVKTAPVINRGIEETGEHLAKTFRTYLQGVKFSWHTTGLTENPEDALWFVAADRFCRNDLWGRHQEKAEDPSGFVLMQHPGVIFRLVRSHSCLMDVVHAETRKQNVWKVMRQACSDAAMPVTAQSWPLDRPLLEDIIYTCKHGCEAAGLPFQWEAWYALVDCLDQCVESVSFSVDALCGFRRQWTNLLRVTVPGKLQEVRQPLEQTLQTRYEGKDASCYLTALWRLLENGEMTETWQERAQQYRQAFENPATESEDIRKILDGIPHFGWTQIPMNLYDEECARAKGQFPRGQGKRIIEEIDARVRDHHALEKAASAKEGKAESKGDRHMELFVLEWALLQTICGQSVQELLGSAAVLAKYVPSPEKQPGAK